MTTQFVVPSAPLLLDSSILISFFFTFRVELTSLWSLLNVADSSCSVSDRSPGWQETQKTLLEHWSC